MIIAGVMSGSSLDGLDIAIVEFNQNNNWKLLWTHAEPFTEEWIEQLSNYRQLGAIEYIKMSSGFGMYIGALLKRAIHQYGNTVDYISFHGHTLIHLPKEKITTQIGNGGAIAAITRIPTITDFRIQDVVKGGEGTPLAPLVESNLFAGHNYYLNLGGIANLTIVDKGEDLIAFDVCPFNQVLNHYSQNLGYPYDEDGRIARSGSEQSAVSSYLSSIPYFQREAPKSLDNNWIVNEFIPGFPELDPKDALASYVKWSARAIANEIPQNGESTSMMISGGGAHNVYFIECLNSQLKHKNCSIFLPNKETIDYKEAILMALMAKKYLANEVNVLSSVTGASSDSIGGALYKV